MENMYDFIMQEPTQEVPLEWNVPLSVEGFYGVSESTTVKVTRKIFETRVMPSTT